MKKSIIWCSLLILICFTIWGMGQTTFSEAADQYEGIHQFPGSYQGYLTELSKKHPNWKFKALYTNLDWNYVMEQENQFGKNLVPKNYGDTWKNLTPGQYNVEVDRGWVDSSRQAVEYCMDPRNFLYEARLFQFEVLSYEPYTNPINGIDKILYGTEFYQTKVDYVDSAGNWVHMPETYADLILRAGQTSRSKSVSLSLSYQARGRTFFISQFNKWNRFWFRRLI